MKRNKVEGRKKKVRGYFLVVWFKRKCKEEKVNYIIKYHKSLKNVIL